MADPVSTYHRVKNVFFWDITVVLTFNGAGYVHIISSVLVSTNNGAKILVFSRLVNS